MVSKRFLNIGNALLILAITVWAITVYMHYPETPIILGNFGFKYSDVVYGVFYTRFHPDLYKRTSELLDTWYREERYISLINGSKFCPIPYIDYKFEYPPVIGLVWYLSTCIAISAVLPGEYNASIYEELFVDLAGVHFLVNSLITLAFFILCILIVKKFLVEEGMHSSRVLLVVFAPSIIMYLVYNWDMITSSLMITGLYFLTKERPSTGGVLIGLAVASKILPALPLLLLMLMLLRSVRVEIVKRGIAVKFILTAMAASTLPFLVLYILSPRGFLDFIGHHSSWYCENCIYLVLDNNVFSELHRILATTSLSLFLLASARLITRIRSIDNRTIVSISFLGITASTVLNYVFSPQMMILILPLSVVVLPVRSLLLYALADAANASIMVTFFKDVEIRSFLHHTLGLPVEVEFNPWSFPSVTQILSLARNLLLLFLLITTYYRLLRKSA
ncbi:MAG: hypothetical protein DRO13_01670 [Thermoprotei archaeon]|nr:MAG: hypothetical protein DRO13_01670 [Thermoprotei archaeon]